MKTSHGVFDVSLRAEPHLYVSLVVVYFLIASPFFLLCSLNVFAAADVTLPSHNTAGL